MPSDFSGGRRGPIEPGQPVQNHLILTSRKYRSRNVADPGFSGALTRGILTCPSWAEEELAGPDQTLIYASACPSQYPVSISRYIAVAVVRCFRASSPLPVRL